LTTRTFSSVSNDLGSRRARHRQNAPADGQVTVFVRLAFVGEGHLRANLEYPRRKCRPRCTSSRGAASASWVSCDVARPSRCLLPDPFRRSGGR
jgi:hypothetical protein